MGVGAQYLEKYQEWGDSWGVLYRCGELRISTEEMGDICQWEMAMTEREHRERCKKHYKKIKTAGPPNPWCEQPTCGKTRHIRFSHTLGLDTPFFLNFYIFFQLPVSHHSRYMCLIGGCPPTGKQPISTRNIGGCVKNIIKK